MNYADAAKAALRQKFLYDDKDVNDEKPPAPDCVVKVVSVDRGKMSGHPGSRVVSPPGTAWADLTCPERAALLVQRGVPESWAAGIAMIWARSCPRELTPDRWRIAQEDAKRLCDPLDGSGCWVAMLKNAGWSLTDIFSVDGKVPGLRLDRAGLCWKLQGQALVSIRKDGRALVGVARVIEKPVDATGRELLWRLWA